jgi:hypothetical protein
MIESRNLVKAIAKINKLTKSGEITWVIARNTGLMQLPGNNSIFGLVYESKYQGQNLRLFKYNYRVYTDEDEYTLLTSTKLLFVESNGQTLWDVPMGRGLEDLYDSVQFKTANAEDFFEKLLSEDEEEDEDDSGF